jgi:hypothetical protein
MQAFLGWILLIFGTTLYGAQIISSINFKLAQRLGLQEKSEAADSLLLRAERYVAYWDLVTLLWLPLAGLLMIINHQWWPMLALIGGAIYLDTAGREAAKNLSFRHEGLKVGTATQQSIFFAVYVVMAIIALVVIGYAITALRP